MHEALNISGRKRLIRNGGSAANRRARRMLLHALEEALEAIHPTNIVRAWLRLDRGRLRVGEFSMAMPTVIRVVAVGKASLPMLKATLSILGQHVASGILVAPKDTKATGLDRRIATFRSSHPVPNEEGIRASRHVLASIARMQNHELLLCLISGGASAMLPAPAHGVTLEGKRTITQRLIQSRASIHEINTVRRHLSELKGGGLVRHCRAGAILSLITSDVPGNVISDIASGLTAPDPTTFRDAINVLNQFNLWGSAPQVVKDHLKQGLDGCFPETPKPGNRIFAKVHNFIIADNRIACEAARRALQKRRTPATILTSSANMEARSLGRLLASVAGESEEFGQPIQRPGALVLGGETTVEVKGTGKGGRNQETALSAIEGIAGMNGVAIAAFGTDGIDGNSNAAGAIIDGHSMGRATRGRLQIRDFMARSDSYSFFRKLGDNIITGSTGTNVGDLYLLVRTK